jgi:hypothetical protein
MRTIYLNSITLILLIITSCASPKLSSYSEKLDLSSKAKYDFNANKIRKNGKGFAIDMKALGKLPKRIAMISFYVDDPGLTKVSKSSYSSSWNTTNTGSDNARLYANYFYKLSLQTMKVNFQSQGMEVLEPQEFLKTNEQREVYQNFIVKHTTMNKIGNGLKKFMKDLGSSSTTIEIDEVADGFSLIKINNREQSDPKKKAVEVQNLSGCMDGQMLESIGYDLCKALNVDAVMIVYNTQLSDEAWGKTRFWLSAVNMHLFGPNPTPFKEGKNDGNSYNKGLFYCGVRMNFSKGLLINPKIKGQTKAEINESANQKAYKNMIAGCSNKIIKYLSKELE